MAKQVEMLNTLSRKVQASALPDTEKATIQTEIEQVKQEAFKRDRGFYRAVLGILGGTIAVTILGAIGLSVAGKPGMDVLIPITTLCVGGLVGVLAPSPNE